MKTSHLVKFALLIITFTITSCTTVNNLKDLEIELTSLKPLPSSGMTPRFQITMLVTNPNNEDLEIEGIDFKFSVAEHKLISGVTNKVPTLKAYSETPVKLDASVNLFDLLKLISYFNKTDSDTLTYELAATINPRGFVAFDVSHEGKISDKLKSVLKVPSHRR